MYCFFIYFVLCLCFSIFQSLIIFNLFNLLENTHYSGNSFNIYSFYYLYFISILGVYADVYMVEAMLNQLEMQQGLKNKIGIEALIETALGMANVEDIARNGASGRLEALHFGVADYAASNRARTTNIGGLNPDYPGDQWHSAISRMTVACRAYGLRPIDGPFGDFKDPEGFKLAARRAAALGCEGKWAIHPSQVELANEVFTPPAAEVEKAKRILVALQEAAAQGKGAAALDGRLIDAASEKMANNVVKAAEAIAAKTK